MAVHRVFKNRNATVAVTVSANELFLPGGPVNHWFKRFSKATETAIAEKAPENKRPRWKHYGVPLAASIISEESVPRNSPGGVRLNTFVGSTAHYALFVDQGTRPFDAKLVPPRAWFSPTLIEIPGRTIPVSGQEAQKFFERGMNTAFAAFVGPSGGDVASIGSEWRMNQFHVPAGFMGNTPVDAGFIAQRSEWRRWKDAGRPRPSRPRRGRRPAMSSDERRRRDRERLRKWRKNNPDKAAEQNARRRERYEPKKPREREGAPSLSGGSWVKDERGVKVWVPAGSTLPKKPKKPKKQTKPRMTEKQRQEKELLDEAVRARTKAETAAQRAAKTAQERKAESEARAAARERIRKNREREAQREAEAAEQEAAQKARRAAINAARVAAVREAQREAYEFMWAVEDQFPGIRITRTPEGVWPAVYYVRWTDENGDEFGYEFYAEGHYVPPED